MDSAEHFVHKPPDTPMFSVFFISSHSIKLLFVLHRNMVGHSGSSCTGSAPQLILEVQAQELGWRQNGGGGAGTGILIKIGRKSSGSERA